MTTAKALRTVTNNNPVANALQEVLKATYQTYLLTHHYHWNVEGPQFNALHLMFETQYNELFVAIDEIAERIRTLDAYALPDGFGDFSQLAKRFPNPATNPKLASAADAARAMLENLVTLNEEAVSVLQKAKAAAEKASDDESVDITVGRITAHQKALWMLRSTLK